MTPSIAIVIPCRNEIEFIGTCLDAVFSANYPREKIEVFVCDGMSDDGTKEELEKYKEKYNQLQVIDNPDRSTPHALNLGIQKSKSEFVVILGAHSKIDAEFFNENVKGFVDFPDADCVGGVAENVSLNTDAELIAKALGSSFGVGNAHFRTAKKEGFVDTVAFGMYRSTVFEKIGLFDEDLVRNQDDEFNFRLTKSGGKILLKSAVKYQYFVRGSIPKLAKQYYQYGYWKVFVNQKHKTVTSARQLAPFFFVSCLYAFVFSLLFLVFLFATNVFSIGSLLSQACFAIVSGSLFLLLLYKSINLKHSVQLSNSFSEVAKMYRIFFVLHYQYGRGYFMGILRFLILRQGPSSRSTELSR